MPTNSINNSSAGGSLRVHTKASQPRTSSNLSFQDKFRSGLRSGIDFGNNAIRQVIRPIPGSAALSASISDAASALGSASRLGGGHSSASPGVPPIDGDIDSLQDEMVRKNHDMLEQQMKISHITTVYNMESNLIKAMFDVLKTIGSNVR
ncbi:MAG: hypothetical protein KC505_02900 [Myxococcales bacterium]|nr:hypothetical protein [Myxococcales bacterium]USN51709.1 MAG: hypothetical protein H6731_04685 [Myxococcales bacterium]